MDNTPPATEVARKIISALLFLLGSIFTYAALTENAFQSTTPAVLAVGCAVLTWLIWPRTKD